MTQRFSTRTAWDLGETTYSRAVREAVGRSTDLCDLTVSNPTRCGFDYHPALLKPLITAGALQYDPQPRGALLAREAVALYYAGHGAHVATDQLILTASTSESYSFLFRLLCDPGDEVLIARPSYPLFDFLATLDDVQLRPYPLFYDHGWWVDFSELQRAIGERTRAIVIVHPNNPTGHWMRAEERMRLEALCATNGLALIVDEVFLDYAINPDDQHARSFALGPHAVLTFVLSGLSKVAGLPQMKAAWIATFGPDAGTSEALNRLEVIADTFLSVSSPVQAALPYWLAESGGLQRQIRSRARTNLDLLIRFATMYPDKLHVLPPEAGWAVIVSLPACGGDADCAERMIREHEIIVHPGSFYGMYEPNRVVLSLLVETELLERALRRL